MKTKTTPFFARFLQGEGKPRVRTNLQAGAITKKYPSDRDEDFVTLKYPSDNDEGTYDL